jgi:hypothetical protein
VRAIEKILGDKPKMIGEWLGGKRYQAKGVEKGGGYYLQLNAAGFKNQKMSTSYDCHIRVKDVRII